MQRYPIEYITMLKKRGWEGGRGYPNTDGVSVIVSANWHIINQRNPPLHHYCMPFYVVGRGNNQKVVPRHTGLLRHRARWRQRRLATCSHSALARTSLARCWRMGPPSRTTPARVCGATPGSGLSGRATCGSTRRSTSRPTRCVIYLLQFPFFPPSGLKKRPRPLPLSVPPSQ